MQKSFDFVGSFRSISQEIDCFNDYTIILTLLALRSGPTEWADTSEAIDLIHTGGTVGAG